jgi:hypothetical protein
MPNVSCGIALEGGGLAEEIVLRSRSVLPFYAIKKSSRRRR